MAPAFFDHQAWWADSSSEDADWLTCPIRYFCAYGNDGSGV